MDSCYTPNKFTLVGGQNQCKYPAFSCVVGCKERGAQELARKGGALPIVAAKTVQGGAGFKDATTTMNMQNLFPSLYGFLT